MKASSRFAGLFLLFLMLIGYSLFRSSTAAQVPRLIKIYVDLNSRVQDEDGSIQSPFRSIAGALQVADDRADIYVSSGDYFENLRISREVNLHGSPDQRTRLLGSLSEQSIVRFEASGTIDHFVLIPDPSQPATQDTAVPIGVAIRNPAQTVEVRNCNIQHCSVGIEAAGSSASVVIDSNSLSENQFGIGAVHNSGKVTLSGNSINSNFTGVFTSETDVEATNNNISGNKHGFHLGTRDDDQRTHTVSLQGNTILNNHTTGVWFDQGTVERRTTLDMGGGGHSSGGNTIGENGTYDVFNQTQGAQLFAENNTFKTTRIANSGIGSRIRMLSRSSDSPRIHVSLEPNVIQASRGEMVPVHATITTTAADSIRPIVVLASIKSSEPESDPANAEDVPADTGEADYRSEDTDFVVRAEVTGSSDRVYTVTYVATDSTGNSTSSSATIKVLGTNSHSAEGGAQ